MRVVAWIVAVLVTASTASAQSKPDAAAQAAAAKAAAEQKPFAVNPPGGEPYTYQPDGRRDPFVSLIGSGVDPRASAKRPDGPAGMAVAEISVRGVVEARGSLVAMIKGTDNKTYVVHPGDKFLDGTIRAITPQGLVVVQEVTDPLSLVKQREIRKLLRSLENAKE